jgi:hypothetical protein
LSLPLPHRSFRKRSFLTRFSGTTPPSNRERSAATRSTSENKPENNGVILEPRKLQSAVHVYHAIHHVLTTKTPSIKPGFSKTTLKTPAKNNEFARFTMGVFS